MAMSLALLAENDSRDSGKMSVPDAVQVGSTRLAPGDYNVKWTGTGDNLEITILKGKNVKATAEGKLVELEAPAASNAIVTKSTGSAVRALDQIQFNDRKEALQLSQSQMAQR
jgi:hypothetical protein